MNPDNPGEEHTALATRLEQQFTWESLLPEDRLAFMLGETDPTQWFSALACSTFAHYRHDPITWGRITATALTLRLSPARLEAAVDAWVLLYPPPHEPSAPTSRKAPTPDNPLAPPLPTALQLERPDWHTWLDDYAAHSAYWAPRAATSYHQAVGLWVLSTIAARRIVVELGSTPVYPTLFLALVSESTHYTKTTAASLGVRLVRRAGCGHLLAPDRTTPQFLLKLMAGLVPQNYGKLNDEGQAKARDVLAFSAQRGWFYEEWGGMLKQMRRTDSPHAELNKLLIVLEGGAESFETGTIQRGLERIESPYLALLGCATPHDLALFMGEGDAWWHDGFWPRFACITPPEGATPSRVPRPREAYSLPASLIVPLHHWHTQLGSPAVSIEEEREASDKKTGAWVGTVGPLPCQQLSLTREVYDAYEGYNDALLELVSSGNVAPDLSPWYGRAHEKALRVAMLLASVHGRAEIDQRYWAEGQVIVEGWRANLHTLVATVGGQEPMGREARLEGRVIRCLLQFGEQTQRDLHKRLRGVSSEILKKTLVALVEADLITKLSPGRKTTYQALAE